MDGLQAMGFPEQWCKKALATTGDDAEAAANYIMGHMDEPVTAPACLHGRPPDLLLLWAAARPALTPGSSAPQEAFWAEMPAPPPAAAPAAAARVYPADDAGEHAGLLAPYLAEVKVPGGADKVRQLCRGRHYLLAKCYCIPLCVG